jgi:hypothetical protein
MVREGCTWYNLSHGSNDPVKIANYNVTCIIQIHLIWDICLALSEFWFSLYTVNVCQTTATCNTVKLYKKLLTTLNYLITDVL